VRVWYLSPFFRRERPQAGRFRQFWQVGAEAIGSDDPALDAEAIVLLYDLYDAVGVRGLRLRVGSLGTPATRAAYHAELREYLRAREDELSEDVRERLDVNPLRAFDADHPGTRRVMEGAPRLLDRLGAEDLEHFAAVRAHLDDAGVPHEIDTTLVRGLDYYTRTIFEFTSDRLGAQSGVGGGGRYDGLIELLGGPPTPAVGWAAGVERMLLASEDAHDARPPVDVYVAVAKPAARRLAFHFAEEARRAGLAAQLEAAGRSVKGQLRHADRIGARYVAIVGDAVTLRDMETGEQRDLAPEHALATILRPAA
jgi:histidyl-tRNA synthetase